VGFDLPRTLKARLYQQSGLFGSLSMGNGIPRVDQSTRMSWKVTHGRGEKTHLETCRHFPAPNLIGI
jgi:hypothetical protein